MGAYIFNRKATSETWFCDTSILQSILMLAQAIFMGRLILYFKVSTEFTAVPLIRCFGVSGWGQAGPYTGFNDGEGPRPNFRRRGAKAPKSQNFPKIIRVPPYVLIRTSDFGREPWAMAPLPPPCIRAWGQGYQIQAANGDKLPW